MVTYWQPTYVSRLHLSHVLAILTHTQGRSDQLVCPDVCGPLVAFTTSRCQRARYHHDDGWCYFNQWACVRGWGVQENDKGAGGYYNRGLKQKKQPNPPQTALCCPNTHTWTRNAQITQAVSRRPGTTGKITAAFSVFGVVGVLQHIYCSQEHAETDVDNNKSQRSGIIVPN